MGLKVLLITLFACLFACSDSVTGVKSGECDVSYRWREIEPLGASFELQLNGFAGDTLLAYIHGTESGKRFIVCDTVIYHDNYCGSVYIETNFHYDKLFLYIFRNGCLYKKILVNPGDTNE